MLLYCLAKKNLDTSFFIDVTMKYNKHSIDFKNLAVKADVGFALALASTLRAWCWLLAFEGWD